MNNFQNNADITTKGVIKRFGHVVAVDGVDLSVSKGEALTIFGPNGAGKTTLLRMIAGLIEPTEGRLSIGNMDVTGGHNDAARRLIGYISHQSLIYGQLTARENLQFFCRLYGIDNVAEQVEKCLNLVGLEMRGNDVTETFSRGMRQRLSIARALVHDPSIVLLDEPFTGLDQHAADMLKNTLSGLRDNGRTVLMITHNLKVGLEMSDRVAIQVAGKIAFEQSTENLNPDSFGRIYFETVGEAHY